jgi:hypothetical protein
MVDSTGSVHGLGGQDRRRIVTRALADATSIGCGLVRRPASALTTYPTHRLVESTI